MKSRLCLCNRTILKKDLIRFAPLMLLAGLVLWAMGLLLSEFYQYEELTSIQLPAIYGTIVAVGMGVGSAICLFTYLTKKKECDAIHALPIRRETLLSTKIIAALIQVLIPLGIFYIFFPGEQGWFYQMGVSLCGWLHYFGLATFCMMLVGRRLAGIILFSLITDLKNNIQMIVENLYLPLLPGVCANPVDDSYLSAQEFMLDLETGTLSVNHLEMVGYALMGVAFLALAFYTYRKRKLERAGDFVVVKWLEPVLACWLGIYISIFTTSIAMLIDGNIWIGLAIGLTIGYFAARMFFARSIKVFRKKNLIGWALLLAVMAGSLYLTKLDVLGISDHIPDTDEIESVTICNENYTYYLVYGYEFNSGSYTTTDAGEIEAIRTMHQNLLPTKDLELEGAQAQQSRFYLIYNLKNGSQVSRTYYITGGEELEQVKYFLSQPECLLGSADIEALLERIESMEANGVNGGTIHLWRSFLEVFLAEAEAGLMYNPTSAGQSSWDLEVYIEGMGYRVIDIPKSAENTVAWLEEYFKAPGKKLDGNS